MSGRRRRAGRLRAAIALFLTGLVPAAGVRADDEALRPRLVRDIDRTPGIESSPSGFLTVGDLTYFAATTIDAGTELWRTDGTPDGTILLGDLCPGTDGSLPAPLLPPQALVQLGGLAYFVAHDCLGGGLWRSDGTVEGTRLVLDLSATNGAGISQPVLHGGLLYFFGTNDTVVGLWRSDGTAAGTSLVRALTSPALLVSAGRLLFFTAVDRRGTELWCSDGTAAGTVRVADIRRGWEGSGIERLVPFGDAVIFFADDGIRGLEPWISDGTQEGTHPVMLDPSPVTTFSDLQVAGGLAFFVGSSPVFGRELWRTDGTSEGTLRLTDVVPGPANSIPARVEVVALGPYFYFAVDVGDGPELWQTGRGELWRTDGTPAGTVPFHRFATGTGAPSDLAVVGSRLLVVAGVPSGRPGLFVTDGIAPLGLVVELPFLDANADPPAGLTALRDTVVFSAHAGERGRELWRSDGTADGTFLLADLAHANASSHSRTAPSSIYPEFPAPVVLAQLGGSGEVLFVASDRFETALWRSDGTEDGTRLVLGRDPDANWPCTSPSQLAPRGAEMFLTRACTNGDGSIWKTDGTLEGSIELARGTAIASNRLLTAAGDRGFAFVRVLGTPGEDLWSSDGTSLGTRLVRSFDGSCARRPGDQVALGSVLYFCGDGDGFGAELWRSDGTVEGTWLVRDVFAGSESGFAGGLAAAGGMLFFAGEGRPGDVELWRSDGTETGTVRAADVRIGKVGSDPGDLVAVGELVFFAADDGERGRELWRSDGTAAGTALVVDLAAGLDGSSPTELVSLGGAVYFTADDGSGRDLWRSDGTAEGTTRLLDLSERNGDFRIALTAVAGRLWFRACDELGCEPWTSDGTSAGTLRAGDLAPGLGSSSPARFTEAGNRVFFFATSPDAGRELWVVPEPEVSLRAWTALAVVAALRRARAPRPRTVRARDRRRAREAERRAS